MIVDYQSLYDSMEVNPSRESDIRAAIDKINANVPRYLTVQKNTEVPYPFIAAVHYRESSLNFKRHMHNGDPLTARTKQVPKGRPLKGGPPFTWEQSAADWINYMGYHKIKDWSLPEMLRLLEKNNGMGYNRKGMLSPYLWAGSNHYIKGKYVADGKFDPNAVDKQLGTAVLIKFLL